MPTGRSPPFLLDRDPGSTDHRSRRARTIKTLDKSSYVLYRPAIHPRPDIPFGVRSVGWYGAHAGWEDLVAVQPVVRFFWTLRGTGAVTIDGTRLDVPPDHVAILFPGTEHRVRALNGPWEFHWFTLDGPFAKPVVRALGFDAGVYPAVSPPPGLFERLHDGVKRVSREGELLASEFAYKILSLAAHASQIGPPDPNVARVLAILHAEWHRPTLMVEAIARRIGCHRSQLSRAFAAAIGVPPVAYLRKLRLQNAISLLEDTDRRVCEIAEACGFSNPKYFSKVMREALGLSPRAFRRSILPSG